VITITARNMELLPTKNITGEFLSLLEPVMLKVDYLSKQGNIKIINEFKSGIIIYPSRVGIKILVMVNKKTYYFKRKRQNYEMAFCRQQNRDYAACLKKALNVFTIFVCTHTHTHRKR
jgi:hypothetical protein